MSSPNPPEIQEMVALFDAEKFAEALEKVEAFLPANQDLAMAWYFKAECLSKLSRYAEAIPCYEKVIAGGGKRRGDALLAKGLAEWNSGARETGVATLDSVLDDAALGEDVRDRASKLLGIMAMAQPPPK